MRLFQLKGDAALDAIVDIIPPLFDIMSDETLSKFALANRNKDAEEMTAALLPIVPSILKKHKAAIYQLLGACDGISADEYKVNATVPGIIADMVALITDPDIVNFFSSQLQTLGVDVSTSQQETTQEQKKPVRFYAMQ